MTKKRVFGFIIFLVAVIAFMVIPKSSDSNSTEEAQTTTSQSTEANEENEEQTEEKKEPFGGIRIGTSNLVVLIVLGGILAVNTIKEIKAEQSEEKD